MAAKTFRQRNYQSIAVSSEPIEDKFCISGFKIYAEHAAYDLSQFTANLISVTPMPASAQD
ncbi:hypothetical protein V2P20_10740 [Methylobacter sp. Wu1]|uniref:hypothetical protein n=1 Tax=Methylobacter sp. Wu1 TaxID=3119359 RepID=UPI002F952AAC